MLVVTVAIVGADLVVLAQNENEATRGGTMIRRTAIVRAGTSTGTIRRRRQRRRAASTRALVRPAMCQPMCLAPRETPPWRRAQECSPTPVRALQRRRRRRRNRRRATTDMSGVRRNNYHGRNGYRRVPTPR